MSDDKYDPSQAANDENHELQPSSPYWPVDYDLWGKTAFWTIEEFAYLSLGFEPYPIINASHEDMYLSPSNYERCMQRMHLVRRAAAAGIISEHVLPMDGFAWLDGISEEYPDELLEACERYPNAGKNWMKSRLLQQRRINELEEIVARITDESDNENANLSTQYAKGLPTKERHSLLKILLGIVLHQYGHKPDASRNETAGQIVEDLAFHGLKISEDTVRKYIAEATDLYWENIKQI